MWKVTDLWTNLISQEKWSCFCVEVPHSRNGHTRSIKYYVISMKRTFKIKPKIVNPNRQFTRKIWPLRCNVDTLISFILELGCAVFPERVHLFAAQDWASLSGENRWRRRAHSRLCGLHESIGGAAEASENSVLLWLHVWTLHEQNQRRHQAGRKGSGRREGLCEQDDPNAFVTFRSVRGDKDRWDTWEAGPLRLF